MTVTVKSTSHFSESQLGQKAHFTLVSLLLWHKTAACTASFGSSSVIVVSEAAGRQTIRKENLFLINTPGHL